MKRQIALAGVCLMLACGSGCVAHREPDIVIAPTYSYLKALPTTAPPSATIAAVPEANR